MMRGNAQPHEWITLIARLGFTLTKETAKTAHHQLDQEKQRRGGYGQLSVSDDDALSTVVKKADKQQSAAEETWNELHLPPSAPSM